MEVPALKYARVVVRCRAFSLVYRSTKRVRTRIDRIPPGRQQSSHQTRRSGKAHGRARRSRGLRISHKRLAAVDMVRVYAHHYERSLSLRTPRARSRAQQRRARASGGRSPRRLTGQPWAQRRRCNSLLRRQRCTLSLLYVPLDGDSALFPVRVAVAGCGRGMLSITRNGVTLELANGRVTANASRSCPSSTCSLGHSLAASHCSCVVCLLQAHLPDTFSRRASQVLYSVSVTYIRRSHPSS
jgi:hypothetical protein